MTEREWLTCTDPTSMLAHLVAAASDRKLRLFAVACCRRIWEAMADERSQRAVVVAEQYADGLCDFREVHEARDAAGAAVEKASGTRYAPPAHCGMSTLGPVAHTAAANCAYFAAVTVLPAGHDEEYWLDEAYVGEGEAQVALLRDIFGNPFRPVTVDPAWLTSTVVALAKSIYESRDFSAVPILADALQDAGCDNDAILTHCRDTALTHVRGCWVVDLLTGRS
jgi:hypothetical protein